VLLSLLCGALSHRSSRETCAKISNIPRERANSIVGSHFALFQEQNQTFIFFITCALIIFLEFPSLPHTAAAAAAKKMECRPLDIRTSFFSYRNLIFFPSSFCLGFSPHPQLNVCISGYGNFKEMAFVVNITVLWFQLYFLTVVWFQLQRSFLKAIQMFKKFITTANASSNSRNCHIVCISIFFVAVAALVVAVSDRELLKS
jgi:hypothetical protein